MDFSKAYLEKVAEHNNKTLATRLPLISFDIHLRHLYTKGAVQQDLINFKKSHPDLVLSQAIIDEYIDNGAVLVLTDLSLKIQFATSNIVHMTGFKSDEVLGKSPKIFQGKKTNKSVNEVIRKSVAERVPFHYVIINYRKDKSTYNCDIKGFPVRNKQGKIVNYIAIEKEVA